VVSFNLWREKKKKRKKTDQHSSSFGREVGKEDGVFRGKGGGKYTRLSTPPPFELGEGKRGGKGSRPLADFLPRPLSKGGEEKGKKRIGGEGEGKVEAYFSWEKKKKKGERALILIHCRDGKESERKGKRGIPPPKGKKGGGGRCWSIFM